MCVRYDQYEDRWPVTLSVTNPTGPVTLSVTGPTFLHISYTRSFMGFKALYTDLKKDEKVGRWYSNLQGGSLITGDVYLRTLGLYCGENNTTPEQTLKDARSGKLRDDFMESVDVLEKKGRAVRIDPEDDRDRNAE